MSEFHKLEEAIGFIPAPDSEGKPITVIGTDAIREGFDPTCIAQALNSRSAPGVTEVVLNPDAHRGYGAPIGCVMASPTHIYPGPVGVDIKCSMSFLQTNVPEDAILDRSTRRALIRAICERTPTGAGKGQRSVKKSRRIRLDDGRAAVTEGASRAVLEAMGIPSEWAERCEDSFHVAGDGTADPLKGRLEQLESKAKRDWFVGKIGQLGSYGGGNHFGEAEVVRIQDSDAARDCARVFGLKDGRVGFLSHCGSRGFGHDMAMGQFRSLQSKFEQWGTRFPGDDRHLVYAPLGTPEADAYLVDMAMAANFATVNHLLINALILEAFQEVLPGTQGDLVYLISHNIARKERLSGQDQWVHRKGATRAFPAKHAALKDTPFYETGHPILLPGNPRDGSMIMAALPGAHRSAFSVNHGAGRQMGRRAAMRALDQSSVDRELDKVDILSNCRAYPLDEAPDAYKDFGEVLRSVELAGLAHSVARLQARFVIKDGSQADD